MLDDRRSSELAYLAVLVARKNIDLPYYIAVRLKPARRTTINASLGFVSVMAIRAGLRTVALLYPFGLNAFGLCLVFDVLADLPVIPAAYLLVGALPKIHLISRIPYITDSEGIRLALKRYLHYCPADLVLDASHNPIMLGLKPHLGTRQTLMTTGSARLLADRSGKLCKPFPVALRCMPSGSAGDDSRFLLITHYSRVNFAKIHRDNVIAWRIFRLFAILNNQGPIVAPSFLIVDQAHLQEAQNVPQLSGNIDN